MLAVIWLFFIITAISLAICLLLFLFRRFWGQESPVQEHIVPSLFDFFTLLYSFFIGFAIVTLWTAHLNAKSNVAREAISLLSAYRRVVHVAGPEAAALRQAIAAYTQAVIEDEWPRMKQGSLSPEAEQRFEAVWLAFYRLKLEPQREGDVHANLTEAGQQRLSRGILLQGNLYPPVWVILLFGLVSVIYGLFFIRRQLNLVSFIFEFMVIFLVLACIYFIYDIDTPFSGYISVSPSLFKTAYAKMMAFN